MNQAIDDNVVMMSDQIKEQKDILLPVIEMWDDNLSPYTKYVKTASIVLGVIFIVITALMGLQIVFLFIFTKSWVFGVCILIEFIIFVLFGLIFIVFGALGVVLGDVSNFFYGDYVVEILLQDDVLGEFSESM